MKSIYTLVEDMYNVIQSGNWLTDEIGQEVSNNIQVRLKTRFGVEAERTSRPTLRLSRMGPQCPRALWYSIHRPEMAEPIPPWATIKYTFGDILEALAIGLAKATGHTVSGEQDELVLDGIVGHRDCVIDGCVVDVKSSSSRGFIKFKYQTLHQSDDFGYLDQLDGYVLASANDPLVSVKDRGYILAIDKQLGHVALYEHIIRPVEILERIAEAKRIVSSASPPPCECKTVPDGRAGNIRLDTKASYSPYKHCCFPSLRTFKYSTGPVDLVKVVRKPDVPEIFRRTNTGTPGTQEVHRA